MAVKTVKSASEDLMDRYKAGERDFRSKGLDLGLVSLNLSKEFLDEINLEGRNARYGKFKGTIWYYSSLGGFDSSEGVFEKGVFYRTGLVKAYTPGARFRETDFVLSDLKLMAVGGADVFKAGLFQSDIRGIEGLDTVHNLETAALHKVIVNEREKEIIEAVYKKTGKELPKDAFDLRKE